MSSVICYVTIVPELQVRAVTSLTTKQRLRSQLAARLHRALPCQPADWSGGRYLLQLHHQHHQATTYNCTIRLMTKTLIVQSEIQNSKVYN